MRSMIDDIPDANLLAEAIAAKNSSPNMSSKPKEDAEMATEKALISKLKTLTPEDGYCPSPADLFILSWKFYKPEIKHLLWPNVPKDDFSPEACYPLRPRFFDEMRCVRCSICQRSTMHLLMHLFFPFSKVKFLLISSYWSFIIPSLPIVSSRTSEI